MTPEQRKSRAMKCELKKEVQFIFIDSGSTEKDDISRLSMKASDTQISHLQPQRVQKLWQKAEEILGAPDLILLAAGNKQTCQVANLSVCFSKDILPPHFVYSKKSGSTTEVRCNCSSYKSMPNVCEHSLAAAERMGILKEYVRWIEKTKASGLNISNLISKDIPNSSGKKGSTSRRKGLPKGKKKEVLVEKSGLEDQQICKVHLHFQTR